MRNPSPSPGTAKLDGAPAPSAPHDACSPGYAGLPARVRLITRGLSCAEVARRTRHNHETVRRFLREGRATARFLAALCEAFAVSGDWLLTGRGHPTAPPGGSRTRPSLKVQTRPLAGAPKRPDPDGHAAPRRPLA